MLEIDVWMETTEISYWYIAREHPWMYIFLNIHACLTTIDLLLIQHVCSTHFSQIQEALLLPMQSHPGWTQFLRSDAWRAQVVLPLATNVNPSQQPLSSARKLAHTANIRLIDLFFDTVR